MQWKNQTNEPQNGNDDPHGGWVDPRSARTKKGTPGREGRPGGDWESKAMNNAVMYNSLPPGSDISDEEMSDIRVMRTITPGSDDVSTRTTSEAFAQGFVSSPMTPSDNRWNNESKADFFSSVTVDDSTGFVERMNTTDRL